MSEEKAKCRGCGMTLKGKAYCFGGHAYHPRTDEQCKVNFYGGFVCSQECDFRSSLRQEQDMPGHGIHQKSLGSFAMDSYNRNWK